MRRVESERVAMDMGLVNGLVQFKQATNLSQIQVAVAAKVMDQDRANGAAALKLLDAASSGTAKAGEALVASATGLGGQIDTYA